MFSRLITRLRTMDPWHIAMGFFLSVLLLALAVRAADEYRWSDWGFGDAQTMLSLRQWEEGGWFANYLLFKPQGYAPVVDLLDDPELRHHAHGTCPGSSPRVGPRLWYTHYPAGYLVPYAVLFKMGLDSLFAVRLLSILFSLAALALMYIVFARIVSPPVSFLAVLFYALLPSFLGYADSLANQPIDDLLRFGFMLAVIMTTRAERESHRQRWMVAAWVIEFVLSLTSFDSVFFVFTWLIGWDLLERRGFRWRRYIVYGMAPVFAHGLQFLQNVWYLGWADAVTDIADAFLLKHGSTTLFDVGPGRLEVIIVSLMLLFDSLYRPAYLILIVLALYAAYAATLGRGRRDLPSLSLIAVLFAAGLSFVLVLPHAARMGYEARQMIPAVSLLVGGFLWTTVKAFRSGVTEPAADGAGAVARRLPVLYLLVAVMVTLAVGVRYTQQDRSPVYGIPQDMSDIRFARLLSTFPARYAPVFIDLGGFERYWDPNYVPGYPQILPLTEYYAGSRPILCFTDAEAIAQDLQYMVARTPQPFSPILIARQDAAIQEVVDALKRRGMITGVPAKVYQPMGRYVLDLTDHLVWRSR